MAYIRKHRGKWQAIIRRKNHPNFTKSFVKKRDAQLWAHGIEAELDTSPEKRSPSFQLSQIRFQDLLLRYRDEISPMKKSHRQEVSRIKMLLSDKISALSLDQLTSGVFARYRDKRLKQVGPQIVLHELNTISVVLNAAMFDWDIPLPENPLKKIRKPSQPQARDRRLEPCELDAIERAASLNGDEFLWVTIVFAIETAMRRGELLKLEWRDISLERRIVLLRETKNGTSREVPLTMRAVDILTHQVEEGCSRPFPYGLGKLRVYSKKGYLSLKWH